MSLKHNLPYWRHKRNLTQRELAERVGVTGPAIAAYETGKAMPRVEILFRIATVLDVDASVLLKG